MKNTTKRPHLKKNYLQVWREPLEIFFCLFCLWHKQATQWDFMFCDNKQAYGFQMIPYCN